MFRLLGLLETLRSHPFLKTCIALKAGTALNLFLSDIPRLSVDIEAWQRGKSALDPHWQRLHTCYKAMRAAAAEPHPQDVGGGATGTAAAHPSRT